MINDSHNNIIIYVYEGKNDIILFCKYNITPVHLHGTNLTITDKFREIKLLFFS